MKFLTNAPAENAGANAGKGGVSMRLLQQTPVFSTVRLTKNS